MDLLEAVPLLVTIKTVGRVRLTSFIFLTMTQISTSSFDSATSYCRNSHPMVTSMHFSTWYYNSKLKTLKL